MAAMRSLCGPLALAMAYEGKLELFVDVLCSTDNINNHGAMESEPLNIHSLSLLQAPHTALTSSRHV